MSNTDRILMALWYLAKGLRDANVIGQQPAEDIKYIIEHPGQLPGYTAIPKKRERRK